MAALTFCASASAATPTVTEFGAPAGIEAGGIPLGITAGSDGDIWFTENASHEIGRISPGGTVTEFPLDTSTAFPFPQDIVGARDGNLWFTEFGSNKIGRITPGGAHTITEFPVAGTNPRPDGITAGQFDNLWFTEQNANKIGQIDTAGTILNEYTVTTPASKPHDITMGPDGNFWFTEIDGNKIGKITPTGVITEFTLPTAGSKPDSITPGPGGLWFTEKGSDQIGRLTVGGTRIEFALPVGSAPTGITAGQDGNLWFTESGTDKIGRITPTGTITHFNTGIAADSAPVGIAAGSDGNLWFTEQDGSAVGRITTALDPPAFQNTTPISIPSAGIATPYPSSINVVTDGRPITNVTVRLTGLTHAYPDDVEVLLVAPGDKRVKLMSDNGGGGAAAGENGSAVNGLTFNFSDAAVGSLGNDGPLYSGLFNVSSGGGAAFPVPAPASPYGTTLAEFNGASADGLWSLYVNDDGAPDSGSIVGGWGLDIKTVDAVDDAGSVTEDDLATSFFVLSNDELVPDDKNILSVSDPAHGTVQIEHQADPFPDFVDYTPDPNYCNDPIMAPPDAFTYTVSGGDIATVSMTVTCTPDPAVADDDSRTVAQDSAATDLGVLANDVDPDSDPIDITAASDPPHGTATVVQGTPDTVTYAPDAGYCNDGAAPDAFTYTVGGGDTAAVSVAVTCLVVPPPADTVVPDTTITKQPNAKLKAKKKATATFEFTSSVAGSSFACAIDGAAPSPCTSPQTYKLKKGGHTFSVAATAAGRTDTSPATFSFTVKKKKRKH